MKRTTATFEQSRHLYIAAARQVRVDGVADTVAVGYVRDYGQGRAAYLVFYGRQGKPAKHFSAGSIAEAEQRVAGALTAAGQAAQRKAEARKEPRKPYHETEHNGIITRSYTTAGTAALIREALKAAFPGFKFSVTSDTFANGSSVDIRYTDGPAEAQVREVYRAFKSGYFDSSQDMYVYHQEEATTVNEQGQTIRHSYGAKYISAHRSYSPAYGFYLHALDLRQAPSLAQQCRAFFDWHRCQRAYVRTSYGHNAGIHLLTSEGDRGDLERFAAALGVQGFTVTVNSTPDGTELTVAEPLNDELDRQFYAAEMSWLMAA